jgi:hypothetical protein
MPSSTSNANPPNKGRRTLLLILAVCAAPFIAGTLAFYLFPHVGSRNYGELLTPQPLPAGAGLEAFKGKWVLLHFDSGLCEASCERKLYSMRQTQAAQGRERDRIERVWIVLDNEAPRAEIAPLYEGVHRIAAAPALLSVFPQGRREEAIFVVDPLGNLMLRFPVGAEPQGMIKDLRQLLKVSRVG